MASDKLARELILIHVHCIIFFLILFYIHFFFFFFFINENVSL